MRSGGIGGLADVAQVLEHPPRIGEGGVRCDRLIRKPVPDIVGERDGRTLRITVSNPVPPGAPRKSGGNKMALANVRQRFELAYGNRAAVTVEESGDRYTVSLAFPIGDAA